MLKSICQLVKLEADSITEAALTIAADERERETALGEIGCALSNIAELIGDIDKACLEVYEGEWANEPHYSTDDAIQVIWACARDIRAIAKNNGAMARENIVANLDSIARILTYQSDLAPV